MEKLVSIAQCNSKQYRLIQVTEKVKWHLYESGRPRILCAPKTSTGHGLQWRGKTDMRIRTSLLV